MLKLMLASVLSLSLLSCAGFSVTGGPDKVAPPALKAEVLAPTDFARIKSLLVSPLDFDESARDSIGMSEVFYHGLMESLAGAGSLRVISAKEAGLREDFSTVSRAPLAARAELASRRGIDALLVTTIQTYTERQGSAAAAAVPARVSFAMALYMASDLRQVWKASYFYQDQALSENLFRAGDRLRDGQGPGWRDAEMVLLEGFKAASRSLKGGR